MFSQMETEQMVNLVLVEIESNSTEKALDCFFLLWKYVCNAMFSSIIEKIYCSSQDLIMNPKLEHKILYLQLYTGINLSKRWQE